MKVLEENNGILLLEKTIQQVRSYMTWLVGAGSLYQCLVHRLLD